MNPLLRSCSSLFLRLFLAAAAISVVGCGGGEEPPPDPPPHVAGSYVLSLQQSDSGCLPPDFDFWEIFAFAENNGNNLPIVTAEITQNDADLQATFAPGGCELSGGIVTGGAFSLTGDCNDLLMERYFSLTGTITSFGSNWDLEGTLVIDVDLLDGGAADGEVDCTVNAVSVSGSGLPAS
jgi:hypothetical protein